MDIVDQNNWNFGLRDRVEKLSFTTAFEFVCYLANKPTDNNSEIQSKIKEKIESDPVAREWKKNHTPLKDLKHFPKYRGKQFEIYHEAARAYLLGEENKNQKTLVLGLMEEIDTSSVLIPPGQILFHGRNNLDVSSAKPYPTFISTSLDPVVALNSALRRAGDKNCYGSPTLYILTLKCPLPGLWGHVGTSKEYELLLPPFLTSCETKRYDGTLCNVVQADILKRRM